MGEEGRAKQQQLANIARNGHIALLGPNCIGMVNYRERVALTFNQVDELLPGERTGGTVTAIKFSPSSKATGTFTVLVSTK